MHYDGAFTGVSNQRATFKNLGSHLGALLLVAGVQRLRDFTSPENVNNYTVNAS